MMNNQQLTTDEIVAMCKRLTYKYPQHQIRDDLQSEAVLAIYERLDTHPDTHPAHLYNLAREAMFDFVNLTNRVVAVPANKTTRAISSGRDIPKLSNYSNEGIKAVYEALQPTKEFDEDKHGASKDSTSLYEYQDFIAKALKLLTEREAAVIRARYFDDLSQEEMCDIYGVSQKTISVWESTALDKMSKL